MSQDKSKICFVIAPIGDEKSETRHRSDLVFKYIIAPTAKECGYEAIRADHISQPGIITSQIIQNLLDAPLVIADLTERNPNVYYELAIRHAIRKPVVQIIQIGESIPFDIEATRTIQFDYKDLESADLCKKELIRQIHSVENDPSLVDTPISVTLDLKSLRQSDNPLEKSNAEIISMLQSIKGTVEILTDTIKDIRRPNPRNVWRIPPSQEFFISIPPEDVQDSNDSNITRFVWNYAKESSKETKKNKDKKPAEKP